MEEFNLWNFANRAVFCNRKGWSHSQIIGGIIIRQSVEPSQFISCELWFDFGNRIYCLPLDYVDDLLLIKLTIDDKIICWFRIEIVEIKTFYCRCFRIYINYFRETRSLILHSGNFGVIQTICSSTVVQECKVAIPFSQQPLGLDWWYLSNYLCTVLWWTNLCNGLDDCEVLIIFDGIFQTNSLKYSIW